MAGDKEDDFQIIDPETGGLNFDEVMKLHRKDPERLEELQRQLVREIIDNAPEQNQRRLEGLQFEIDARRQMSKNPMQSFMAISKMFWEQGFSKLKDALNGEFENPEKTEQSCDILDFDPNKKTKH